MTPAVLWEALWPGVQVFYAPLGAVYEPPLAELVALTSADDGPQPAGLGKFNVANRYRSEAWSKRGRALEEYLEI